MKTDNESRKSKPKAKADDAKQYKKRIDGLIHKIKECKHSIEKVLCEAEKNLREADKLFRAQREKDAVVWLNKVEAMLDKHLGAFGNM